MPHQVGIFCNFAAVDFDFTLIFVNVGGNGDFAVTIFRFGGDFCLFRADTDKLFVVTDTQRRARAKVKDRFCTVGFALRIFSEKHV